MPKRLTKSAGLKRASTSSRRFLSYSNEFKQFVGANRGVFSAAQKLIGEMRAKKLSKLSSAGGLLTVEKVTFPLHTNKYNLNIFRVHGKGFNLFVKESVEPFTRKEKHVWETAQRYLDERSGGFMGYNVRLIKPHMLMDQWLVSDFYSPKRFVNVEEMPQNRVKESVVGVVDQLGKNLHKLGVEDVRPRNVFFDKSTKTLVLFDLISQERYSIKQKLRPPVR